jgi:hypothetical protein
MVLRSPLAGTPDGLSVPLPGWRTEPAARNRAWRGTAGQRTRERCPPPGGLRRGGRTGRERMR